MVQSKSLVVAFVLVIIVVGAFGYAYSLRYSITQAPPHVSPTKAMPIPPTTTLKQVPQSQSIDMRTWGERFRDPKIPEVKGVEWQTYVNKEFGFQLEYPRGWEVKQFPVDTNEEIDLEFYVAPYDGGEPYLSLGTLKGRVDSYVQEGDDSSYWSGQVKENKLVPYFYSNEIGMFLRNPKDSSTMPFFVLFRNDDMSFVFTESLLTIHDEDHRQINEHIVKTFRFLK